MRNNELWQGPWHTFPFKKLKALFLWLEIFQCIGTGVETSCTHRIKTHLDRQTHWLLGLLIHFKQCLFAIKTYFLVKEIKLYMPEHLHRSHAILKDIGWKSLDIPPRVLCLTTAFASAPSPPISLTLCSSQKCFILQPSPVSLKRASKFIC